MASDTSFVRKTVKAPRAGSRPTTLPVLHLDDTTAPPAHHLIIGDRIAFRPPRCVDYLAWSRPLRSMPLRAASVLVLSPWRTDLWRLYPSCSSLSRWKRIVSASPPSRPPALLRPLDPLDCRHASGQKRPPEQKNRSAGRDRPHCADPVDNASSSKGYGPCGKGDRQDARSWIAFPTPRPWKHLTDYRDNEQPRQQHDRVQHGRNGPCDREWMAPSFPSRSPLPR
jgi:hypothetical protein